MKIRYVRHTGANTKYVEAVLFYLHDEFKVDVFVTRLDEYARIGNVPSDVLLYHTYAEERVEGKFNPSLVEKTDKLFREFAGLKILVCTHDNGNTDSFPRFEDGKELPRIKCFPTERFSRDFNVVMVSTASIESHPDIPFPGVKMFSDLPRRDIMINCKLGNSEPYSRYYPHNIRSYVVQNLQKHFIEHVDFGWCDGRGAYTHSLRMSQIAVGAPGFGQYSATHQLSLRTGTLLFAHTCFKDIEYLPWYDLQDGEDFVSYDQFNFVDKLRWLINEPDRIEHIRHNGRRAFGVGYDPQKSAHHFLLYLEKELR